MGLTLITTGTKSGQSRRGFALSIALHSALVIAAAAGTSYARTELSKPVEEKLTYVAPPKAPPPAPARVYTAPREVPTASRPQAPRVQLQAPPKAEAPRAAQPAPVNLPVLPVAPVTVPTALPKIDIDATAMLSDVVRRVGDEIASATSGIGSRSGGGPASAAGSGSGRAIGESYGNTAFDDSEVDRVVVPITNATPDYPAHLRNAGVTGAVQARFIVGTNGRVEASSIKIVSTPHPELGDRVRRALLNARFRAAEKGGQKVRQLVEQSFVFELG